MSNTNIILRKIEPRDREEVLAMMRTFYDSDALIIHASDAVLRNDVDACLANSPYVEAYVFEVSDAVSSGLAGYSMLAKSFSTEAGGLCVWIEDLYLKPEFRRQGLGSRLFRFVQDTYGETAARLRLEVEPDNERAIATYRAMGYEPLGYLQMIRDRKF